MSTELHGCYRFVDEQKSGRGGEPIRVSSRKMRTRPSDQPGDTQLVGAVLSQTADVVTLPAGAVLFGVAVKRLQPFAAPTLGTALIDVGVASNTDLYVDALDLEAAAGYVPSAASLGDVLLTAYPQYIAAETTITATVTLVGDNLEDLTAGAVEILVYYFAPGDPDA